MSEITVRGARLHNLKNISFSIPKNRLVVFTGLSGSGKSTMAFDTLHKEGQRQYMESLGMVTYESRPPVDAIVGLSPSISVDQHNSNRSPRSTVGTATVVYTYLRVLFARAGHRPCPQCGADVPPQHETGAELENVLSDEDESQEIENYTSCPNCGARLLVRGMAFFSFNKPAGACPACTGLGTVYTADLPRILDEEKSLAEGGCWPGSRALSLTTSGSCAPPDTTMTSTSTRQRPSATLRKLSATCCSTAWIALPSAATSHRPPRQTPSPKAASRAWSRICCAATPSTQPIRTPTTWKSWSA